VTIAALGRSGKGEKNYDLRSFCKGGMTSSSTESLSSVPGSASAKGKREAHISKEETSIENLSKLKEPREERETPSGPGQRHGPKGRGATIDQEHPLGWNKGTI